MRISMFSALLALGLWGCSEETTTTKRATSDADKTADMNQVPEPPVQVPEVTPPVTPEVEEPVVELPVRPEARPIVVAIGGWNSCEETPSRDETNPAGMRTYQPMMDMLGVLEESTSEAYPYVAICTDNNIEFAKYLTSDEPQSLYNVPISVLYENLFEKARTEGRPLALIGHSFGGWFAMDIARNKPADVFIDLIATIDPISPINCDPNQFASVLLDSLSGGASGAGGCSEAPSDFTVRDRTIVRDSTLSWVNYYQTENLTVLRSSPIPQSHENFQMGVTDWEHLINAHSKLGEHPSVWQDIGRRLWTP